MPSMPFEALVGKNAVAGVTFVAKRIRNGAFRCKIGENHLAFEQRCKRGAVRAARSCAAGAWSLIVIMTIGAGHRAGSRPGSDEAGHIRILANGLNGVERGVGSCEFVTLIGLHKLACQLGGAAAKAIGMATVAEFGFFCDRLNDAAR